MKQGIILTVAVHTTETNQREEYTTATLLDLLKTVDFNRHYLFISDNGSYKSIQNFYEDFKERFARKFAADHLTIHKNGENLGTAKAINQAIKIRKPGQMVCKLDDDVIIHQAGWLDIMEECTEKDPTLAIVALKRRDLEEWPDNPNPIYKSRLAMLPHTKGERWIVGEYVQGCIGTCTLFSSEYLDKTGSMAQIGRYGLDDFIASVKANVLGMKIFFLTMVDITHLDCGGTAYCQEKIDTANKAWDATIELVGKYERGEISVYTEP